MHQCCPECYKNAGYTTGHFGKWHLSNTHGSDAPSPLEYGYDEYAAFNLPGRLYQMHPDSTIYKTIDFIRRHKDEPFFVNAWIHATHTPHYPKQKYLQQFSHLNDQEKVYAAVIAEYDARIGELFDELRDLGIDSTTIVIFSSDNGPEITGKIKKTEDNSTGPGLGTYYSVGLTGGLKGRKRSLFTGGVRTPFIVRWPGKVKGGTIDKKTAIAAVDLLPTFVELAGALPHKDYKPDGESIVSAIKGDPFSRKKPIYWQWLYPSNKTEFWPGAAIQTGNWKLLTNKELKRTELYNINTDWSEQEDLSSDMPDKTKVLLDMINEFEATLPADPPASCWSGERGRD